MGSNGETVQSILRGAKLKTGPMFSFLFSATCPGDYFPHFKIPINLSSWPRAGKSGKLGEVHFVYFLYHSVIGFSYVLLSRSLRRDDGSLFSSVGAQADRCDCLFTTAS